MKFNKLNANILSRLSVTERPFTKEIPVRVSGEAPSSPSEFTGSIASSQMMLNKKQCL